MLGVPFILLTILAANAYSQPPMLDAPTSKSLSQFGACFTSLQDRDSRAWAFLPTEHGGTFTNSAAKASGATYWLAFREARPFNQIHLIGGEASGDLRGAVSQCR